MLLLATIMQYLYDSVQYALRVWISFNNPTYVGMCLSDLGEVLVYEFYYDYMKNKYGNNSRLLFTDSDSLMNEFKTENV